MPTFEIRGPLKVPTYDGKAAKIVDPDGLSAFWESSRVENRRGCYVFAVRAGKGMRPVYVGRATKNFKQEVFASHKLEKYQRCLADIEKGTPVLFFVMLPATKGKPNVKAIESVEEYLIQIAVSKNPDLLNVKGTELEDWGIAGVIRGGSGKRSKAAAAFKQAMGL